MFAPQVCFVTSSLKGMITYLLWQCLQLGGIVEEVPPGTTMLKKKKKDSEEVKMQKTKEPNKKSSEVLKHAEHLATTSKQDNSCKEV